MTDCKLCGLPFSPGNYNKGRAKFCRSCRLPVKRAREKLRRAGQVITAETIVEQIRAADKQNAPAAS